MAQPWVWRKRRRFLQGGLGRAGLGVLAGCGLPSGPWAQRGRPRRIGYLAGAPLTPENQASIAAFREGLRELGYVESHNLQIEGRHAGSDAQLDEPVADLVRLEPEGILAFSSTVARDLPTRQRTLRGAIAWSHDLLEPDEQALFRRLSVFVGGWSFDAAGAICDDGDLGMDALDGLDSLVAKSLVKQGVDLTGEPRFWMLETIREYAAEQLDASGEDAAMRRRHAQFFLAFAERAAPRLNGPEQVSWLDRLTAEHDNVRAAITWMQGEGGDLEGALRLAITLMVF